MSREENNLELQTLRASGFITNRDKTIVTGILNSFGLSASFEPADTYPIQTVSSEETINSIPPNTLDDITSKHNVLVREHFDDFAARYPEFGPRNITAAFHIIVNGGYASDRYRYLFINTDYRQEETGKRWYQSGEPIPLDGITLVKRSEVGLDDYKGKILADKQAIILARYAIIAGTIPEAVDSWLDSKSKPLSKPTHLAMAAISSYVRKIISDK